MKRVVAAAGAFMFDGDKIFLAKFAKKFNGAWAAPGGKLDFGEGWEEAVIREVKEETNIDIKDPVFLNNGAFVNGDVHCVYTNYIAQFDKEGKIILNEEFSEHGFFTRDEVKSLCFSHDTVRNEVDLAFEMTRKWSGI